MNLESDAPRSYCSEDPEIRAEMLVGHLSDMLRPARELVATLRLQSNTSVTTRGKLEHLTDLAGALWDELRRIRDEVERLRAGTPR